MFTTTPKTRFGMMVARRALKRSPDRTKKLFASVRLVEKSDIKGIQGPAHTLHVILDLLQLDLKCIKGAWIIIDEHGAKVDLSPGQQPLLQEHAHDVDTKGNSSTVA